MVLIIVVSGELGSYTHCRLVVRFPIFFLLLFSNLALHCGQRIMYFQSPRNFFFRYTCITWVRQDVWIIYATIYVIAIVATPFNLQLPNFGTTLLMWLSKNSFLKCLKYCFFCRVIALFLYFFKILCNFEEALRKNQWR